MFMFAYRIEMVVVAPLGLVFGLWLLVFGVRSAFPLLHQAGRSLQRPKTKARKPNTKNQTTNSEDDARMATNFGHHS